MSTLSDTKKITFEPRWFLGTLGAFLVAIFVGFWAFYSHHISRETQRMNESIAQVKTNNDTQLDSIRRAHNAKIEVLETENRSKLREADLANQAAIAKIEDQARHEKENLNQAIDILRQKLSVSRSS